MEKWEFCSHETGTVFEAESESAEAPKASYYRWFKGLPEAQRKPDATFYTTFRAPLVDLYGYTVCTAVETEEMITRPEDGAVLCQLTSIVGRSVLEELVHKEYELLKTEVVLKKE